MQFFGFLEEVNCDILVSNTIQLGPNLYYSDEKSITSGRHPFTQSPSLLWSYPKIFFRFREWSFWKWPICRSKYQTYFKGQKGWFIVAKKYIFSQSSSQSFPPKRRRLSILWLFGISCRRIRRYLFLSLLSSGLSFNQHWNSWKAHWNNSSLEAKTLLLNRTKTFAIPLPR